MNTLRSHWQDSMMVMVLEHGDRKVKQSHMDDVIDMEMSTFEIIGMPDR